MKRPCRTAMLLPLLAVAGTGLAWAQTPPAAPSPPPATADDEALEPAIDTSAVPPPARRQAPPQAGVRPARAADRVELDPTQITGNRELPKVLYIVPWKRADLGDPVGRPPNSLLDEVLAPIDREVFRRQNRYYEALQPDGTPPDADTAAGDER